MKTDNQFRHLRQNAIREIELKIEENIIVVILKYKVYKIICLSLLKDASYTKGAYKTCILYFLKKNYFITMHAQVTIF